MTEKKRLTMPRAGGVVDLRERQPGGAKQFSGIVKTKTSGEQDSGQGRKVAIKGFTAKDKEQLKKSEKRYAASRRAATVSGRDALYE